MFDEFETRAKSSVLKAYEIENWLDGILKEVIPLEDGVLEAVGIQHLSVVALDLAHVIVTVVVYYEWFDQEIFDDEKELANEEPIPVDLGATVFTGGR